MGSGSSERFDTIVIGGSQAGLAAAYHLRKAGTSYVILEASDRVGHGWRARWDSLRLFTPAKYNGLPGHRFPAPRWNFPTKDEMADYLESYAKHFDMNVRTGVAVDGLTRRNGGYVVNAGDERFEADNVIVATGAHQHPKVPAFAAALDPGIEQVHSVDYTSPAQLKDGPALIVGLGNSGAELAIELAPRHQTYVSGKPSAEIPFKHGGVGARFGLPVIRFAGRCILTYGTPMGRKVLPKLAAQAAPLIRTKAKHLEQAGVEFVARVTGVEGGRPVLDDGRVLDVRNVIWCTGFRYRFDWIDLPVFDEDGTPRHTRGVAEQAPGLYFIGLAFQYAAASDVVTGVARDAAFIVKHLARRSSSSRVRAAA